MLPYRLPHTMLREVQKYSRAGSPGRNRVQASEKAGSVSETSLLTDFHGTPTSQNNLSRRITNLWSGWFSEPRSLAEQSTPPNVDNLASKLIPKIRSSEESKEQKTLKTLVDGVRMTCSPETRLKRGQNSSLDPDQRPKSCPRFQSQQTYWTQKTGTQPFSTWISQHHNINKLCCSCGIAIEPNPTNMCVACLRTNVDITEGIPKQATIHFCRSCERYLQPPADWIHCSLESRELLQLCLKKLKGLSKVKLIDAGFIWTEPNSKRIKVKVTVQSEVMGSAILQQVFVVEFTVVNQMCDDCHRVEAKDFWRALVQVRQKAENKKTFYYLEQLILKHKIHENTLAIKPIHEGLDFYYATEAHARRMVDFLNSSIPCRYQHSKKLISHDASNTTYNYKFSFSVEIAPISKNSIVCLSKKMTQQFGGISPLCVVVRVTKNIHLIDPCTAQMAEITGSHYWRDPFNSVFNPKQLQEYVVMDVEPIKDKERKYFPGQGPVSQKHVLCDVYVLKASEVGVSDNPIHTRSHIGHLLKPFDTVLGYHVSESNANDDNFEMINKDLVPEVILVKKFYGNKMRKRTWKLKHLPRDDTSIGTGNQDYNEFLEDLEEDPEYRGNVNIYRNKDVIPVDADDFEDPSQPRITLEEMLDDLDIDD